MTVANDATTDLLAAIRAALAADSALVALVGQSARVPGTPKIFARPPAEENMPYVTYGDSSFADESADGSYAQRFFVDVTCWQQEQVSGSGGLGFANLKAMAARVSAVLHETPLTIAGRNVFIQRVTGARDIQEVDGLTNRTVVSLTVLIGHP